MRTHSMLVALTGLWIFNISDASALDRPKWMDEPGIVMAGNWEEPSFRARRMGRLDFTLPPDKLADYARERSPEILAELMDLGVNFLMIYCYKGAGMETERQGMEDAKRFAELARKSGMRVGTYIGGTMLYERLFKEEPNAPQWQAFGPMGEVLFYNPGQKFRYAAVRNHPGFIEYLKKPVRYAIEEIKTDLIHFDNFGLGGASYDATSKQQFRAFLRARGMAEAEPPVKVTNVSDPLVRAWLDFKCQALADHYAEMSRFIRSLNPRCGVECNPGSVGNAGRAAGGVDHARLLPLGNASWDESWGASWNPTNKTAFTRIKTLKVNQLHNSSTFLYTETPLDAAESMAFNVNCLGSVTWFEWGKILSAHLQGKAIPPELKTYIRFFLDHQDLYRHSKPVADVAVLRTFAEANFATAQEKSRRSDIEQGLIQGSAAWRIIYDEHAKAFDGYRVVIAPEKTWLTPDQQKQLADFAAKGGALIPAMSVEKPQQVAAQLRDKLRLAVEAPSSVAAELCQQENPRRVLVHFVNYNTAEPVSDISVKLRSISSDPSSARLLSPDLPDEKPLTIRKEGNGWAFTLPRLTIYGVVVLDGAKLD
ncbi:MAG: hypothetical protein FJ388_07115 [Verrucomicrobia bacterium]|nr:hypothetical protein [Verrucomicrobiota bacterium]